MLPISIAKIIKNMLNILIRPLNLQVTWRPYLEALEDEFQAKRHCPSCNGPLWCYRLGCEAFQRMETYRWRCHEHDGEFEAGPHNPQVCRVCGSAVNGGFGLPFAPVVDIARADLIQKTFLPYDEDNDWGRAANLLLKAWIEAGGDFGTIWSGMNRREKARAVALFKKRSHNAIRSNRPR